MNSTWEKIRKIWKLQTSLEKSTWKIERRKSAVWWRRTEWLACFEKKGCGEEGHQVDDDRCSWLEWEDRDWEGLG